MNPCVEPSAPSGRRFRIFSHRGAAYRILAERPEIIEEAIVTLRRQLTAYIEICPEFRDSLIPVAPVGTPPPIALDMHAASASALVGPLAAVAGAVAEHSARRAIDAGDDDVIVENGGDTFLCCPRQVIVSLYAGASALAHRLALRVPSDLMPVSICSSSGVMGHSVSFGKADLVTVVAKSASLADAVATALCNRVETALHIEQTLEVGMGIAGVDGVIIVIGDKVGMIGDLPELIRQDDIRADSKITRS